MREMTVFGVSFDIVGKQPIVLLKTQDENKFLPIWIGHPEAAAILMKLQGSASPRPMTHDLLTSILDQLEAEIARITVTELRENTFYAQITIVQNGHEIEIDSRPSDAIALAVRADAQIFASEEVIEESGIEFEGGEEEAQSQIARVSELADLDPEEFRRFLDEVTPEQFAEGLPEGEEEAGPEEGEGEGEEEGV
jgi:bifunctional DNase/RNase